MSCEKQIQLAESRTGRIELHFLGMFRDHKIVWHGKGIVREIPKKALTFCLLSVLIFVMLL